ncbi:MAG: LysM peptidoglycan-binding domain-containing protein [Spirochaetes bacterium]|nr:LysM peptidoglycan-binding domain-containing protein [Spirochaetota bacterium]
MQKLLIVLTASIFIISCGEKIPVKEMTLAKMEISNAISVMAKKYAPQEIDEAEKKLIESHDFIKQDALDKSKDSAVASQKKAKEAYEKSIPLLAKDTLDIAEQSLDQAEALYAEVLAESEYKQAEETFTKAGELYEQKSYYQCYEKSVEADQMAKEARNVSIGKKEILNKSIAEVKAVLAEAEKYNASTIAKENMDIANENLIIAEESYRTLELKKGFMAVETAGINADEAYLTALKETASGKIESAEKLYSEAEQSEGAEAAKDELNASKEALTQSKSLFEDAKYKESISSSEESERLSDYVLGSMSRSAKEKIASAEGMYVQAKNSAGAAIAVNKLNEAGAALDLSKSLYKESRYKASISTAEESERLSRIVIDTKAKDDKAADVEKIPAAGKGSADIFSDEYFTYKVRYIPERRDCLWRIAEKYYSNPFYWPYIYKANKDKIYNPDLIWPDMLLKVPKLQKSGVQEEKKQASPVAAPVGGKVEEKSAPVQEESRETEAEEDNGPAAVIERVKEESAIDQDEAEEAVSESDDSETETAEDEADEEAAASEETNSEEND